MNEPSTHPENLNEHPQIPKGPIRIVNPITKRETYIRIDTQRLSQVKDELEYATNWRRAFTNLYTHLKWLNAYAKINYIGLYK